MQNIKNIAVTIGKLPRMICLIAQLQQITLCSKNLKFTQTQLIPSVILNQNFYQLCYLALLPAVDISQVTIFFLLPIRYL